MLRTDKKRVKKGEQMIRKATKKDLDSVVRIYESVLIEEEKRNEKMVGWVRGILSLIHISEPTRH